MRTPKWVTAIELDQWAATPRAKLLLPELVRRLVRATVAPEHLNKFDFPAEGEVQRPGYERTTRDNSGNGLCTGGPWCLGIGVRSQQR